VRALFNFAIHVAKHVDTSILQSCPVQSLEGGGQSCVIAKVAIIHWNI
jgi:hypothetical protein